VVSRSIVLGPAQACAIAAALAAPTGPRVHIEVDPADDHAPAGLVQRGPVVLYAVEVDVSPGRLADEVRRARWVACESPCDRVVDTSRSPAFQIGGPRTTRSRAFTLPPEGRALVEVDPGRKGVFATGWVFAGIGGAGLLAGVGTMVFADNDRRMLAAGGITLAAALPLLIAGAVMIATSRTRVSVRHG
jgi:hypothetical protein